MSLEGKIKSGGTLVGKVKISVKILRGKLTVKPINKAKI